MADNKTKFYYVSYIIEKQECKKIDEEIVKKLNLLQGSIVINCHPLIWRINLKKNPDIKTVYIVFWDEIPKNIFDLNKKELSSIED